MNVNRDLCVNLAIDMRILLRRELLIGQGTGWRRSKIWCAGINRQEAEGEDSLREGSSDPLGPEFCAAHREVRGEA